MKFSFSAVFLISQLGGHAVEGFTTSTFAPSKPCFSSARLQSTPSDKDMDPKRMQEILTEEATNPTNMAAAAEAMKNIKPEDMTRMIEEMDNMNGLQKGALKAMGMDPEMMKKTMAMMRDNPQMVESAQKLMQNMTPEELLEQSRAAQQKMKNMTPEELEETSKVVSSIPKEQLDQAVEVMQEQQAQSKAAPASVGPKSDDPDVIDAMFKVGELLSEPATGDVSFAGFASVPVIQLLSGDREFDLSPAELKECWNDGSLGATRVDRAGFERVWNEVQEYFEDDIMGEARREAKKLTVQKKSRPGSASSATSSPSTVTIGDGIEADQLKAVNEQVKNMSDSDVDAVLDQMNKMGPAEEARMRAMGVDPSMMKRTAELMKNNPMMKKAAQSMMKNMTPEQMLEASQKAQEQMKGMSKEDMEKALNDAAMATPPKQD